MSAPLVADWEIKAARLLVRLLEDRKAPVDGRLRGLASAQLPQENIKPTSEQDLNRAMSIVKNHQYRSILKNHPDLSDEERRAIEDIIRQTEDLHGVLRKDEHGT